MASIANDKAMLDELINGSGDLHSLTARMVFDEIPDDCPLGTIKGQYHDLRQRAKGYEFGFNYYSLQFSFLYDQASIFLKRKHEIFVALYEKSTSENWVDCGDEKDNPQPSTPLTKCEGSTTNS